MTYQLLDDGAIHYDSGTGVTWTLPPTPNGTPEWLAYAEWLAAGNTPLPVEAEP